VKDSASQVNKNFYRVLLYSGIQNHGKDFFGFEPCNLYKNEEKLKKVTAKLESMMRFNVWCDVVLTKFGNYFIIADT
jgi:hypothetical protein